MGKLDKNVEAWATRASTPDTPAVDSELKKYASPAQSQAIDAINEHGEGAAEFLGITRDALRTRMRRLKTHAARKGYQPHGPITPVAEGYAVKGTSSLIGADGEVKLRWVKTDRDQADRMQCLFEAMKDAFAPLPPVVYVPQATAPWCGLAMEDLLLCIPIGDPHLGMYSWALETGNDFDLQIAERLMCSAVEALVDQAPPAHTCLLINLGDFFHSDNMQNQTMRSKHHLDVDGRWPKVLHVGMRVMRHMIDCALRKFKHVDVINAIGNHDDHSSVFLTVALDMFYEDNPRVTVGRPPGKRSAKDLEGPPPPVPFSYYPFGDVLIGVTHGDKVKNTKDLALAMAAGVPDLWGAAKHRVWHCGHVHHFSAKDVPGVTVYTHRTLAGKDAYASEHAYFAPRGLGAILYHKVEGRVAEHYVSVDRIERTNS